MKELIGKKVDTIYVSMGEDTITFCCGKELISYATYGDCCSTTWFADIVGVKNLIGYTVQSVEETMLEKRDDNRSRQEFDKFYGVKLITDHGHVDIVYRNSSNGYYGGDISLTESVTDEVEIKDDWSA